MIEEHGHGLLYFRAKCRSLYEHRRTQYCIAVLIILAFMVDIGEAQLMPSEESVLLPFFLISEIILTCLFTLELLVNMLSKSNDFFKPFWSHAENLFDTLVVVVSIASIVTKLAGVQGLPNIKMFRLIRVFRVVRLFKRFKSLNRIIMASRVKQHQYTLLPPQQACTQPSPYSPSTYLLSLL